MNEPFYVRAVRVADCEPESLRYVFAVVSDYNSPHLLIKDDDGLLTSAAAGDCEPFRESETRVCPLCGKRFAKDEVDGACAACRATCAHSFVNVLGEQIDYCRRCLGTRAGVA